MHRLAALALTFALVPTVACGGAQGVPADRGLAEIRDELARARADRDRLEQRLVALEVGLSDARARSGGEPARPDARRAEPAASREALPARDGFAEPERTSEGDGPRAQTAYDAALALVHDKKHDAALDAFAGFLVRWPDHPLADSATYWRGMCFLAKGDLAHAAAQFEGVVARPKTGAKLPDALYELHAVRRRLGDAAGARAAKAKLLADHPTSEAARRLAAERDRGGA